MSEKTGIYEPREYEIYMADDETGEPIVIETIDFENIFSKDDIKDNIKTINNHDGTITLNLTIPKKSIKRLKRQLFKIKAKCYYLSFKLRLMRRFETIFKR